MLPELCPQCGSLVSDGICPHCGKTVKQSPQIAFGPAAGTAPKFGNSEIYKALLLGTASVILLALPTFLWVYVFPHWPRRQNSTIGHSIQPTMSFRHNGPVARLSELKGTGRIYLVQIGPHTASYSLDDFAGWLRTKYSLDVQILPLMELNPSDWNPSRKQYVAELLYQRIEHEHPDLAANPKAFLIGFTDADMYPVYHNWSSTFAERDSQHHTAIISSDGLEDSPLPFVKRNAVQSMTEFQAKLRRILLKNVAILYWNLPVNNDPTSVLHQPLNPDIPAEDIFESDLDPDRTAWGRSEGPPVSFLPTL
jgi:hypothetical protein